MSSSPHTPTQLGSAALLAGLPMMWPHRLSVLLDAWEPVEAWNRATSARADRLVLPDGSPLLPSGSQPTPSTVMAAWRAAARGADPQQAIERHAASGIEVVLRDDQRYPSSLAGDIEPPGVLFVRGDLGVIDAPRAAIVGTRRCTGVGAGVARELGRELAAAGVVVVSGLALGIDGAAHRGVLDTMASGEGGARPVGVVGSGLDCVYPARHKELWDAVGSSGVLLSEAPAGARPAAWRFPARNRMIAALADVVVVVESHAAGGSLLTVGEAERRDVPVLAVPGSVRSPAAAGTNQLIADGCHPVCDARDVLIALGLTPAGRRGAPKDPRPKPSDDEQRVLEAFSWEPATLEQLAVRSGLDLPTLAMALERLLTTGWVSAQGGWYERVVPQ
ncbi:MAG: DNA-processing protein DprA [Actinomycetota bacterium]